MVCTAVAKEQEDPGVTRDHDRFGQRSVRVEIEGMADIHIPAGYCVHPRTGTPQLAAFAVGVASRKTLGRRAGWNVRVRRRTLGCGLRLTCGQPRGCGTQATRHEGSGCHRGDKSSTHGVSFRKTPLRWGCYCGQVASLRIATDARTLRQVPWEILGALPNQRLPSGAMTTDLGETGSLPRL